MSLLFALSLFEFRLGSLHASGSHYVWTSESVHPCSLLSPSPTARPDLQILALSSRQCFASRRRGSGVVPRDDLRASRDRW